MTFFPNKRLRRLRKNEKVRELVQEVRLSPKDFICPIFIQEDLKSRAQVSSMSEIERLPLSEVTNEVSSIIDLKIPAIMLFGIPSSKDEKGTSAYAESGIVQNTISEIRKNFGEDIIVMADVCLCQYTSSGHCGLIKENKVDNDSSIETLTKIAISQAKACII